MSAITSFLTKNSHRVYTLTRIIENPRLLKLKRSGVMLPAYEKLRQPWIQAFNIQSVLDIGANIGQFALTAKAAFPQAHLYSFEPLPDCYAQMRARLGSDPNFTAFNIGLGIEEGELAFERNVYSPSSSFLQMAEAHKTAFPFTRDSQTVKVRIRRLDDVAAELALPKPFLAKIDVQGYEDQVLLGGAETIKQARLLIIETSFERLYEGQPLFDDIFALLTGWGFSYYGSFDQLCSPIDGRILQADSIFVNQD